MSSRRQTVRQKVSFKPAVAGKQFDTQIHKTEEQFDTQIHKTEEQFDTQIHKTDGFRKSGSFRKPGGIIGI
ncbi:hypothetical protein MSSIT_0881 [Methanosarcina siciliae T4/M]|uniref:Uncharacterized protein n=1 Tax=Methanosarcina siciliae T4/M TaxID=1434120 RepID=A0A0E3P2D6_9EURY|nr:hypothetical protein MSSIT_0881 [Methanosarcina siciliae T4/M]